LKDQGVGASKIAKELKTGRSTGPRKGQFNAWMGENKLLAT
tara:strand:+ start:142 stop:264 length:123 start_codon:yes stop_codon:yes gene_type:complete